MAKHELPAKPTPEDMEVTPERALKIKMALIRQHADQHGLDISGWIEVKNGVKTTVLIKNGQPEVQTSV